jgi:hypothetical protein
VQLRYADDPLTYRPGACNIGPEEIASRRRSGIIGLVISAALALGLVAVGAAPWLRVLVFLPLAGAFVSFEQARRHFCAGFAMAGIRNFGTRSEVESVDDAAARATDRRAALVLFAYCALAAAVVTILFVLAPI